MPFQLAAGVNAYAPSAAIVRLPTPATVMVSPADLVTPLKVKAATVRVSPSTSTSLASTLPASGASSAPVTASAAATGASFTAETTRFRVEVEVRLPSETVTTMVGTAPFQLAAGVKRYLPSAPMVRLPRGPRSATVPAAWSTPSTVKPTTLRRSPSTSRSLARTLPARGASSAPVRVSAAVAGASFKATMAMPSVEVVAMEPSVTVQVTVGTAPDQSAAGVKLKEPSALTVSEPTPAMSAVWPADFTWPATV